MSGLKIYHVSKRGAGRHIDSNNTNIDLKMWYIYIIDNVIDDGYWLNVGPKSVLSSRHWAKSGQASFDLRDVCVRAKATLQINI